MPKKPLKKRMSITLSIGDVFRDMKVPKFFWIISANSQFLKKLLLHLMAKKI
jgi:hypothetical protein